MDADKSVIYVQQFKGPSKTLGSPLETEKDRAKLQIMEFMPTVITNDEIIVIDPEACPVEHVGQPVKETNILKFQF